MKVKKSFVKHLWISIFCFTVLLSAIPILNQPLSSEDPAIPYSDSPIILFEH